MCGRFYRLDSPDDVAAHFEAILSEQLDEPVRAPSYNIPPSRDVLTVRYNPKTKQRTLDALQWGLIPHFSKDRKAAFKCSNARSDTVDVRPSYRAAFQKRRCLVSASGFFEWWTGPDRKKHPYAFELRDQRLFGIAALWENWLDPETGEWVRSIALITTEANELVGRIHDRMPVVLHPRDYATWLGEQAASPAALKKLLQPYPAAAMSMWPVHARMNRPDVDEPSLLEPLAQDPLLELATRVATE